MRAYLAIALFLAATARAQDTTPVVPPDDAPVAVKKGDPSPADGVFLTTDRAARTFQECAESKQNADQLAQALQNQPTPESAKVTSLIIAGGVGLAVGVVISIVVFVKLKGAT